MLPLQKRKSIIKLDKSESGSSKRGPDFIYPLYMKYFNLLFIGILTITTISCEEAKESEKSWQLTKTIELDGVNPIGIASLDDGIWLSDGDHNRVVKIDSTGKILASIDSLDRPMHIDGVGKSLFIPQYGNDQILKWEVTQSAPLTLTDSLDAPAGISSFKEEIAIADFYNNRILYTNNGRDWKSFGVEGKHEGEFYYPTDVHLTADRIWVADAYNNRIQVFDKDFQFIKAIGSEQNMNATTGIFVDGERVYATDFENDRVLIFDHQGNLVQEISDSIEKPTDLIVVNNKLHVLSYRNSVINIFELKEQ